MALHENDFLHLLHEAFGPEKAGKFPDALTKAMRDLCDATYRKGFAAREPDLERSYEQGFTEGFDSGTHQAYVEIQGTQADNQKAHEHMAGLAKRHRKAWMAIAKAHYDNCTGQIFRRKGDDYGWRVIAKDGRVMAITQEYYSTELGAKLAAALATGMNFG